MFIYLYKTAGFAASGLVGGGYIVATINVCGIPATENSKML